MEKEDSLEAILRREVNYEGKKTAKEVREAKLSQREFILSNIKTPVSEHREGETSMNIMPNFELPQQTGVPRSATQHEKIVIKDE